jgi:hypothetical protein
MKNTLKFLFVALAMTAMISCGGGKAESEETQDSTTVETPVIEEAPAPDTTAVSDTTAAQ